jgi:hypothetical protein
MNAISKSLCWAAAMLFLAAGARFGFIDGDTATTALLVVPILAVLSLRQRRCCTAEVA